MIFICHALLPTFALLTSLSLKNILYTLRNTRCCCWIKIPVFRRQDSISFKPSVQGRNFGLKSDGYQFRRRTRRPCVPSRKGRRMVWMGRKYPLLIGLSGMRDRHELSQQGPGLSPSRKWFYCNLISTDCLFWQQVTANSSRFRPEKWGTVPLNPKSGVPVPLVPCRKLRLCKCLLFNIITNIWYISWTFPLSLSCVALLLSAICVRH